uniref:Ig-like domain-containing protein n=1 Tax=Oreochromis aureus TaxID=47969 RepID=A0A668SJU3_OREAU
VSSYFPDSDEFICVLSVLYSGEARVKTEVQAGPLYRVLGSPLYITCSVSGFRSENTDKHFEFRMTKPSNPNFEIQIISSNDDNFGYSNHQSRVRKNEIALKRLSPNSVRFEIKSLLKDDEGEYECTAVNLEGAYDGEYSAKTVVKVIEDSLSVSSSASTPLSLNEGEALTLTCLASSSTSQHTHLSVAWYLHKDGQEDAQPIISLNRDFTLSPGQGFERRYQAGLIRLDKLGEATYNLQIAKVEPSDRGRIYCQAQEWIQDPDGSWYIIIQKIAEEMTLTVKATGWKHFIDFVVEPSSPSLAVEISAQPAALQEGQELMLSCDINTQDVEKRFFSVAWLKGSVELARIGPTGVLTVAPVYSVRQKNGELRAARSGNGNYRLILKPVRTEDQGEYTCRVWPQERGQDDAFIEGEAKDSSPQRVSISTTDTLMEVSLISRKNQVTVGEKLELMCRVRGPHMPVTVTWSVQREAKTPDTILTLSPDGTISWSGDQNHYQLRVESRKTEVIYYLLVIGTSHREGGNYQCNVSVLLKNVHKELKASNQLAVIVNNPVSRLDVSPIPALTRNMNTDITIKCSIVTKTSESSLYSITWLHEENAGNKTIVSLDRNSIVTESQTDLSQRISMRRSTGPTFELTIRQARISDKGSYTCKVGEWLQDPRGEWYLLSTVSKSTVLTITEPANDLRLDKKEQQLTAKEGEEVELNCNITSGASGSSVFYGVIWRYAAHSSSLKNASLVELDHTGLVSYPDNKDIRGLQERLRLSRPTQKSFYLSIQKAHEEDSGTYWCQVDQYQLDNKAHWQLKASDSGGAIKLSVKVTGMITLLEVFCWDPNSIAILGGLFLYSYWFWGGIGLYELRILVIYRNSTLQHRFEENVRLRYDHPDPSQFSLTFLNPGPENSGLYFCEVEEWLPSLSRGWRKVAVEKSGHFNVSVLTEGRHVLTHLVVSLSDANAVSECNTTTYTIVIVVLIIIVVVILLLMFKVCRSKGSQGKKSTPSLWAESLPMNNKPSGDD